MADINITTESCDAWKTVRDRNIETMMEVAINTLYDIDNLMSLMEIKKIFVPKKCFAFVVMPFFTDEYDEDLALSQIIENEDILEALTKVDGIPVMLVKFDIGKSGEGMKVTSYMPMPYDALVYNDPSKFLEKAENNRIVYEKIIPEDKFNAVVGETVENEFSLEDLEVLGIKIGEDIYNAWN